MQLGTRLVVAMAFTNLVSVICLDRLPALAAELVRQEVDVTTVVSSPAAQAVKQVTTRIPIAMIYGSCPVEDRCGFHPVGR
jgi:ABC-type uncharacterized transport system substrate-binding protein